MITNSDYDDYCSMHTLRDDSQGGRVELRKASRARQDRTESVTTIDGLLNLDI
jgi:hypothetical protein